MQEASHETTYCMVPLIYKRSEQVSLQRQKVDQWLPGTGNWGREEMTANGHGISFWGDENVQNLDYGDDYSTPKYT